MSKTDRLAKDPEKEHRILASATVAFAEKGYRKSRVEEIAKAADVSKGLVFKYYQTKENLYLQTLKVAADRVMSAVDYNVWQESEDLVQMVVNATRYKISLQLKYPTEFKLLITALTQSSQLPKAVGEYVNGAFITNTDLQKEMLTPVIQRQKLKPGVKIDDVYEMIQWIETGFYQKIQSYLQSHPDITVIEDMDELIDQMTRYFSIFEHGFIAD